ncbi:MAG: amino acid ABC transporter permease [Selenomonadaceae bacterium]|nr:amino acid ABC transporter permease [Selenomonadaceae bacterium]
MEILELFSRVFIRDGAWLFILEGLWVTVQISVLSLLGGTVLGAVVCFFRLRHQAILRGIAKTYIAVLRGSPVLMLLMLFYYSVFADSSLSPVQVAILTFSLHTSAHVAELLRASLLALDWGQVEAAHMLGLTRWQAFRFVALPQLLRLAKPVYQSTAVNLIQWTSVVGYVTITDLTRVMNNIASRTMQPMITLTVGMLIYIGMAYLVYGVFALGEYKSRQRRKEQQT